MDETVRQSMLRWPSVPAVYGWLSLTPRGQWRIHPDGCWESLESGQSIQNEQILAFINRNYMATDDGQWYFQNGPQRVYVRLARAPLILTLTGQPMQLTAHTGQKVQSISQWVIDPQGHLYAQTDLGPACIHDQDLETMIDWMKTDSGEPLIDWWQSQSNPAVTMVRFAASATVPWDQDTPLMLLNEMTPIELQLGFVRTPTPTEPLAESD